MIAIISDGKNEINKKQWEQSHDFSNIAIIIHIFTNICKKKTDN